MSSGAGLKRPRDEDEEQPEGRGELGTTGEAYAVAGDDGLDGTGLEDDLGDEPTGLENTGLGEEDDDLFGENADEDDVPDQPAHEQHEQSPDHDAALAAQDAEDELHDEQHVLEAEEDVPQERKKKGEDMQAMMREVSTFIAKLENAYEHDRRDFEGGQPALKKLQMVKELEEMIAMKKLHDMLLNGGILGAIKAWLEPLKDPKSGRMVLPHTRVRAAVYRALERLPLDTHHQESRDRLKASEIGPTLVFYSKCSAETPANQRAANDLVQKWIMPIVEEGRTDIRNQELAQQRKQEAKRNLKLRRLQDKEAEAAEAARQKKAEENLVVGNPGYRYHARIPKQARLDYVEMPAVPQALSQRLAEKQEREGGTRALIKKQVLKIDRINRTSGKQRSSSVKVSGQIVP